MSNGQSVSTLVAAILAAGIVAGGWLVGQGFVRMRTADRYVTVKGVAERVVTADIGLWPLTYVATDDDLGAAQSKIESQRRIVMGFLRRQGIDSAMTELQGLEVTDRIANPYGESRGTSRFIVSMNLMVRSEDPPRLQAASQAVGELVNRGVVLTSGHRGFAGGPTFLFQRLNELKPGMIAEATASARQAAEQFAKDSRSSLGGIRRASQGVFEILPRDQAPGVMEGGQIQKTLRVVTTIEYFLRN